MRVHYSVAACSAEEDPAGYDVPEGTVLYVSLMLRDEVRARDIGIDLRQLEA